MMQVLILYMILLKSFQNGKCVHVAEKKEILTDNFIAFEQQKATCKKLINNIYTHAQ